MSPVPCGQLEQRARRDAEPADRPLYIRQPRATGTIRGVPKAVSDEQIARECPVTARVVRRALELQAAGWIQFDCRSILVSIEIEDALHGNPARHHTVGALTYIDRAVLVEPRLRFFFGPRTRNEATEPEGPST